MRRAAKVDANQAAIVAALRKAGASVQHAHTVGGGCPDLIVGRAGRTYLLEVKTINAGLNDVEQEWFDQWEGHAQVVRSPEDALRAIGAIR